MQYANKNILVHGFIWIDKCCMKTSNLMWSSIHIGINTAKGSNAVHETSCLYLSKVS